MGLINIPRSSHPHAHRILPNVVVKLLTVLTGVVAAAEVPVPNITPAQTAIIIEVRTIAAAIIVEISVIVSITTIEAEAEAGAEAGIGVGAEAEGDHPPHHAVVMIPAHTAAASILIAEVIVMIAVPDITALAPDLHLHPDLDHPGRDLPPHPDPDQTQNHLGLHIHH
eukprot:TRINITY_DN15680_c0_g1::TRINITY_DN15680_c0_g1_i1::g.18825::m.18825 TRINITY_DN15680_c0_g1::TRINITY_DN15680_c0_g1_i1::g.18825  ORF type:complete len:168 (+),score=-11.54,LSPR/PF06049.7/1.2e+03,LSPR/PF06049.7/12,LSPR/PF06049.7/5.5 TRINITY_DN15680_c0_g1_i1:484-987(+)